MNEIDTLIRLYETLKYLTWGNMGMVIAGVGVIVIWQKRQISMLKDYISLWKPSELKKDVDAYISLKDQIKDEMKRTMQNQIEEHKKKLEESEDKYQESLKLFNVLHAHIDKLQWEFITKKDFDPIMDFPKLFPEGSELVSEKGELDVMWTVKFPSGHLQRYKFPRI